MKALLALSLLLASGCASAIHAASTNATDSAVAAIDTQANKAKLDDLASSAGTSMGTSGREALIGPDAAAEGKRFLAAAGAQVQTSLVSTRDALLDAKFHAEIASARDDVLGADTQARVDAIAASAREQLAGAPLRADVAALQEQLGQSIAKIQVTADAEASKYKTLAGALAASALGLLLALGVAVYLVVTHRRLLLKLAERV